MSAWLPDWPGQGMGSIRIYINGMLLMDLDSYTPTLTTLTILRVNCIENIVLSPQH